MTFSWNKWHIDRVDEEEAAEGDFRLSLFEELLFAVSYCAQQTEASVYGEGGEKKTRAE